MVVARADFGRADGGAAAVVGLTVAETVGGNGRLGGRCRCGLVPPPALAALRRNRVDAVVADQLGHERRVPWPNGANPPSVFS